MPSLDYSLTNIIAYYYHFQSISDFGYSEFKFYNLKYAVHISAKIYRLITYLVLINGNTYFHIQFLLIKDHEFFVKGNYLELNN